MAWRKGRKNDKKGLGLHFLWIIGHTQDICFANPKSGSYRPKGAFKQRSVNKIQRSTANVAKGDCTFCGKKWPHS